MTNSGSSLGIGDSMDNGEQGEAGDIKSIGEKTKYIDLGIVSHVKAYMYRSGWCHECVGAKVPP